MVMAMAITPQLFRLARPCLPTPPGAPARRHASPALSLSSGPSTRRSFLPAPAASRLRFLRHACSAACAPYALAPSGRAPHTTGQVSTGATPVLRAVPLRRPPPVRTVAIARNFYASWASPRGLDPPLSAAAQSRLGGGGAAIDVRAAQPGEIHVIVGPMFAGKTTALLRRVQAAAGSGRTVALIKSDKDNRYGLDSVVTHDGTKVACWALSELSSFHDKLGIEAYDKVDVIGIDEAQFFDDLYDFCCKAADLDGKIVVVAGLDGDYKRKKFGSVLDVVPLADSVTKLTARCELCGRRAFFSLRKIQETKTELIGGADVYMPVCRQHYMDGQVVIRRGISSSEIGSIHDTRHLCGSMRRVTINHYVGSS